ncbi:MAG: permease [Candidatus Kapabacteria bacterium]|jgi:uncharacterized membrane protein YraQ (UPF0718 family)|nr:permease [Candidatus Kapabacteria bacterium]
MDLKKEWKIFVVLGMVFLGFFYLPLGIPRFDNAIFEALYLAKWYAQEHVVFCLLPAFFIAGAISVFLNQQSVMKYLGAKANKVLAYSVASVSGSILAVCSCTVLPLFTGIYRMGAGLGPAVAFLYSGPAINVLAIILTAKVLGVDIGIARAVGAIVFSIVIGLIMHFIYRKEELAKVNTMAELPEPEMKRKLWQNVIYFALMIFILIFANWGHAEPDEVFFYTIWQLKWVLTSISGILFAVVLAFWFDVHKMRLIIATIPVVLLTVFFYEIPMIPFAGAIIALGWLTATDKDDDMQNWFVASWDFTKQIAPLLVWGVLIAGFALGRPGNEGIIPSEWIHNLVGGNSLSANLFASVVGALMYFATLTEIPIVQGLVGSGMGKGPALALLLAGPALSLPNMLVIRSVIGIKKTAVFVTLVVIMATISGYIFGLL